jgi:rhodanese-related sulfurtransferase
MNPGLIFLLLAVAFVAWTLWRARPEIKPEELHAALKAGTALLVDVREPAEWAGGTARGAALLSLSDLRGDRQHWRPFLEQNRDKRLLLYCQSGARSALAASTLRREGRDVRNAGSLAALDRAGWPVCRPRR